MQENLRKQKKNSDYSRKQVLGRGTYGLVYKAQHKQTNQIVAIKKVQKKSTQGLNSSLMREIAFLRKINHQYIVRFEGYSLRQSESSAYLIFQYVQSDLYRQIKLKGTLSPQLTKKMMKKLVEGLAYCHKQGFIHRDIKPQNILVDREMETVKLTDFGLVRQMFYPPRCLSLDISSLFYKSPELLFRDSFYGFGIDMWGIGCILAECILGKPLFCDQNTTELTQLVKIYELLGYEVPEISEQNLSQVSQFLKGKEQRPIEQKVEELKELGRCGLDLLNGLLKVNPEKRLTSEEVLEHAYFRQIEIEQQ